MVNIDLRKGDKAEREILNTSISTHGRTQWQVSTGIPTGHLHVTKQSLVINNALYVNNPYEVKLRIFWGLSLGSSSETIQEYFSTFNQLSSFLLLSTHLCQNHCFRNTKAQAFQHMPVTLDLCIQQNCGIVKQKAMCRNCDCLGKLLSQAWHVKFS